MGKKYRITFRVPANFSKSIEIDPGATLGDELDDEDDKDDKNDKEDLVKNDKVSPLLPSLPSHPCIIAGSLDNVFFWTICII